MPGPSRRQNWQTVQRNSSYPPAMIISMLDRLTEANFDDTATRIVERANRSIYECNCHTLHEVVRVLIRRAMNRAWSTACARLCLRLIQTVDPRVRNSSHDRPRSGEDLVRTFLINGCQHEFDKIFGVARTKPRETSGQQPANPLSQRTGALGWRHLGLMRFVGELFKLLIVTEYTMNRFLQTLLRDSWNPSREQTEALSELLNTAGPLMCSPRSYAIFDDHFARMKHLAYSLEGVAEPPFAQWLWSIVELVEGKQISPQEGLVATASIAQAAAFRLPKLRSDSGTFSRVVGAGRPTRVTYKTYYETSPDTEAARLSVEGESSAGASSSSSNDNYDSDSACLDSLVDGFNKIMRRMESMRVELEILLAREAGMKQCKTSTRLETIR